MNNIVCGVCGNMYDLGPVKWGDRLSGLPRCGCGHRQWEQVSLPRGCVVIVQEKDYIPVRTEIKDYIPVRTEILVLGPDYPRWVVPIEKEWDRGV